VAGLGFLLTKELPREEGLADKHVQTLANRMVWRLEYNPKRDKKVCFCFQSVYST